MAHAKRNFAHLIDGLIAVDGFGLNFSGEDRINGDIELRKDGRLCDRNIVRAKGEFYLRCHGGEFSNGREVFGEIGFWAVEPDFAGVESVSGEEQAVGAVDE